MGQKLQREDEAIQDQAVKRNGKRARRRGWDSERDASPSQIRQAFMEEKRGRACARNRCLLLFSLPSLLRTLFRHGKDVCRSPFALVCRLLVHCLQCKCVGMRQTISLDVARQAHEAHPMECGRGGRSAIAVCSLEELPASQENVVMCNLQPQAVKITSTRRATSSSITPVVSILSSMFLCLFPNLVVQGALARPPLLHRGSLQKFLPLFQNGPRPGPDRPNTTIPSSRQEATSNTSQLCVGVSLVPARRVLNVRKFEGTVQMFPLLRSTGYSKSPRGGVPPTIIIRCSKNKSFLGWGVVWWKKEGTGLFFE